MRWLLGGVGATAALIVAFAVYRATETTPSVPPARHAPIAHAPATSSRLDAREWETVRQVVRMRGQALAPRRTALYRSFAAYIGLQGLIGLRPVLPGHCAVAILYLYNNLRDLHNAYPGENWRPLRLLIRKEPSLQACAPKVLRRAVYVS
jgi:hypothetical protein